MLFSLVGWNPEEGRERLSRASPFTSRSNDAHSRTQKEEVGQSQEVTLIELFPPRRKHLQWKGLPPPILILSGKSQMTAMVEHLELSTTLMVSSHPTCLFSVSFTASPSLTWPLSVRPRVCSLGLSGHTQSPS